jgi:hypothetical protein
VDVAAGAGWPRIGTRFDARLFVTLSGTTDVVPLQYCHRSIPPMPFLPTLYRWLPLHLPCSTIYPSCSAYLPLLHLHIACCSRFFSVVGLCLADGRIMHRLSAASYPACVNSAGAFLRRGAAAQREAGLRLGSPGTRYVCSSFSLYTVAGGGRERRHTAFLR